MTNNGTLTIPANKVKIDNTAQINELNVTSLNILPRGCVISWYGNNTPQGWFHDIPTGWIICDGQNGTPDLRGRFVLGAGHTNGLTNRELGHTGGTESHTLTYDEMPQHNHTYYDRYYIENKDSVNNQGLTVSNQYGSSGTDNDNNRMLKVDGGTSNAGNNIPHENIHPFCVLIYIMKT